MIRFRPGVVIVATLVFATLAGPVQGSPAGAQTTAQFPQPLVSFVPSSVTGPVDPALAVQWAAAANSDATGSAEPDRVPVALHFAQPVVLPTDAYRVSVLTGSPLGARSRASFVRSAGVESGTLETSQDGLTWIAAGTTAATFSADAVVIDVPINTVYTSSPTSAMWVEAQLGTTSARTSRSPAYSLAAFLGVTRDGLFPSSTWGDLAAPPSFFPSIPSVVLIPGVAPTVSVDNQALIVDERVPVPDTIGGQVVTSSTDVVTFMPGFTPTGATNAAIAIDRTTGTIRALTGSTGIPADRTGDQSWLVEGLSATDPGGAAHVVIDLEAVTSAMGISIGDADTFGIGLQRTFTLADGSTVSASSVVGTLSWLQQSTVPVEPAPAEASSNADRVAQQQMVLLVTAGVAAVLVVAGLLSVRARRRRSAEGSLVAGRSPDEALAAFVTEVDAMSERVDRLGVSPNDPDTRS